MPRFLKHPLGQAVLVLVLAFALFRWGIPYLPPVFGVASAPVPKSVLLEYMLVVTVGTLLWVSDSEERWRRFKEPVHRVLVEPELRITRYAFLVAVPLLVGFVTYQQVKPSVTAPVSLRSIHPAPPGQIDFHGKTIVLASVKNPLRSQGSMEEHYEHGKEVYYQNCLPCHGDALNGQGHFGHGFNPEPLSFQDNGTIAQLSESFVFWRIAKGGPGLPVEGTPWNSAMPVWENFLSEDDIWSVIIFLYQQTGWTPRVMDPSASESSTAGAAQ